jgi:hypothetical protein
MRTIAFTIFTLFTTFIAYAHPAAPKGGGDELKAEMAKLQQCMGQVRANQKDPTVDDLQQVLSCRVATASIQASAAPLQAQQPQQTDVVTQIGRVVLSLGQRIEEVNDSLNETDKWVGGIQSSHSDRIDRLDYRISNLPTTTKVVHEYVNTPSTPSSTPTIKEPCVDPRIKAIRDARDANGPDSRSRKD